MNPPDEKPHTCGCKWFAIDGSHLPCPHGRPTWHMCPHCNGVNDIGHSTPSPVAADITPAPIPLPTQSRIRVDKIDDGVIHATALGHPAVAAEAEDAKPYCPDCSCDENDHFGGVCTHLHGALKKRQQDRASAAKTLTFGEASRVASEIASKAEAERLDAAKTQGQERCASRSSQGGRCAGIGPHDYHLYEPVDPEMAPMPAGVGHTTAQTQKERRWVLADERQVIRGPRIPDGSLITVMPVIEHEEILAKMRHESKAGATATAEGGTPEEIAESIVAPHRFDATFRFRPHDRTPGEWSAMRAQNESKLNLIRSQIVDAIKRPEPLHPPTAGQTYADGYQQGWREAHVLSIPACHPAAGQSGERVTIRLHRFEWSGQGDGYGYAACKGAACTLRDLAGIEHITVALLSAPEANMPEGRKE